MVKAGKVYVAESAVYGYTKKGEFFPAWKRDEVPEDRDSLTYFKGLGELNPSQTYTMFMDDSKRRLLQIQYPEDLIEFNNLVSMSKKHLLEEEGILVDIR